MGRGSVSSMSGSSHIRLKVTPLSTVLYQNHAENQHRWCIHRRTDVTCRNGSSTVSRYAFPLVGFQTLLRETVRRVWDRQGDLLPQIHAKRNELFLAQVSQESVSIPLQYICVSYEHYTFSQFCADPDYKYEEDGELCDRNLWYKSKNLSAPNLEENKLYHRCGPDFNNSVCSVNQVLSSAWIRTPVESVIYRQIGAFVNRGTGRVAHQADTVVRHLITVIAQSAASTSRRWSKVSFLVNLIDKAGSRCLRHVGSPLIVDLKQNLKRILKHKVVIFYVT